MLALAHPQWIHVDDQARLFGILRVSTYAFGKIQAVEKEGKCVLPEEWEYNPGTMGVRYKPTGQEPLALHFAGKLPVYYISFLRLSGRPEMAQQFQTRWADIVKDMQFYALEGIRHLQWVILGALGLLVVGVVLGYVLGWFRRGRKERRKDKKRMDAQNDMPRHLERRDAAPGALVYRPWAAPA